jgi:tetratricopeptide (TPR) repeat protein
LSTQTKAEDYKKLEEKESQYEEKQRTWTPPTEAALDEDDKEERVKQLSRSRHPTEAQAFYNRAKRAYDLEDYWTTIQLCQQAIELVSDKAEYYYLLGQAQSRNPKWRLDAERNLKIATNLDPWKSDYLVALGKLYEHAGMTMRAQRMFDQAKAVDPSLSSSEQQKDG